MGMEEDDNEKRNGLKLSRVEVAYSSMEKRNGPYFSYSSDHFPY
jgi:hypothetical protein